MDLIDLGLRYLNKIIIMKQEAQVGQHTYMGLDKLKNSSILSLELYIFILLITCVGIRTQNHILGFGFWPRTLIDPRMNKQQ